MKGSVLAALAVAVLAALGGCAARPSSFPGYGGAGIPCIPSPYGCHPGAPGGYMPLAN